MVQGVGLEFRVEGGLRFRVLDFGISVLGCGFRVYRSESFGLRASGYGSNV